MKTTCSHCARDIRSFRPADDDYNWRVAILAAQPQRLLFQPLFNWMILMHNHSLFRCKYEALIEILQSFCL